MVRTTAAKVKGWQRSAHPVLLGIGLYFVHTVLSPVLSHGSLAPRTSKCDGTAITGCRNCYKCVNHVRYNVNVRQNVVILITMEASVQGVVHQRLTLESEQEDETLQNKETIPIVP